MSERQQGRPDRGAAAGNTGPAREAKADLKAVAHDLGNLAYRLTFLRHNLPEIVPDPARREETASLLDDTAEGLRRAADRIRSLATGD